MRLCPGPSSADWYSCPWPGSSRRHRCPCVDRRSLGQVRRSRRHVVRDLLSRRHATERRESRFRDPDAWRAGARPHFHCHTSPAKSTSDLRRTAKNRAGEGWAGAGVPTRSYEAPPSPRDVTTRRFICLSMGAPAPVHPGRASRAGASWLPCRRGWQAREVAYACVATDPAPGGLVVGRSSLLDVSMGAPAPAHPGSAAHPRR